MHRAIVRFVDSIGARRGEIATRPSTTSPKQFQLPAGYTAWWRAHLLAFAQETESSQLANSLSNVLLSVNENYSTDYCSVCSTLGSHYIIKRD